MSAIRKGYSTIKELPSEVRSSFDERDQEKWMNAYNSASETKSPEDAKVDAWMSMVDAPSSLAVETWGSVEVRDADGELVPVDTIAEYSDRFIENGGLMHDSHSNVPVGTVWNWEIRKHPETGQDGIVYYFNIYRDGEVFERARDDILSGRKQAVSIGAEAPRGGYKCDDRGCYVERDVTDLYELSICETPANPEAYFINVGKDIAKAKRPLKGEVLRIGIKDYTVHQDYTTCPLQKCKHDLLVKGFSNVHLTNNGIILARSEKREYDLFKAIRKMGYPFRYDLKKKRFEIIPDYGVEQAIEEALGNDWAHEDQIGHVCLTKEIPKEVFIDWYERGFIVKIGDFYCLKADDVAKDGVTKSGYKKPNGEQLSEMLSSMIMPNDGPWMAFCETLTEMTDEAMQRFNLDPSYEEIVRNFFYDAPGDTIYQDAQDLQYAISGLGKSAKKKVKKDGGAMGVGDAGASNPVYGSKPTSLTNPDKKYGKKRKTKKEFQDDGNIHGLVSKSNPISKRCPNGYHNVDGQCVDANGNVYQGKQQEQKQPPKTQSTQPPKTQSTSSPKYDQIKDMMSDAVKEAKKKGISVSSEFKTILNKVSAGKLEEAKSLMRGLFFKHPKEMERTYRKFLEILDTKSSEPKSSEKPKTTEKPKKKEEKNPLLEDYPKIKGKGRINHDDDLVAVYRNGKLEYQGLEDYNPYRDDDNWKYNETYNRYELTNGKDKVLIVRVG